MSDENKSDYIKAAEIIRDGIYRLAAVINGELEGQKSGEDFGLSITEPYMKIVKYEFDIDDHPFLLSPVYTRGELILVDIEEAEKNGQEDTHCYGALAYSRETRTWRWIDGLDQFNLYVAIDNLEAKILGYLRENPPPGLE